jgi:hypothetical protein
LDFFFEFSTSTNSMGVGEGAALLLLCTCSACLSQPRNVLQTIWGVTTCEPPACVALRCVASIGRSYVLTASKQLTRLVLIFQLVLFFLGRASFVVPAITAAALARLAAARPGEQRGEEVSLGEIIVFWCGG